MAQNPERMSAEQMSAGQLFARLLPLWNFNTKINYGRMLVTLDALADMARWDHERFLSQLVIAEVLSGKLAERMETETSPIEEEEARICYQLLHSFLMGVKAGQQAGGQDKPHSA